MAWCDAVLCRGLHVWCGVLAILCFKFLCFYALCCVILHFAFLFRVGLRCCGRQQLIVRYSQQWLNQRERVG